MDDDNPIIPDGSEQAWAQVSTVFLSLILLAVFGGGMYWLLGYVAKKSGKPIKRWVRIAIAVAFGIALGLFFVPTFSFTDEVVRIVEQ